MVSHGDIVAQVSVRRRKHNMERNSIGRAKVISFLIVEPMKVNLRMGA